MIEYKLISSQTLFDHPYAKVILDTLEYEGKQFPYFYLTSPVDAVATVGLTDDGCIILTRQYRHPVRQVIYDLPAGHLEPGEDPITGARREFEEETGYFPHHIEKLGYYNQFPGVLRAATNLFFASDLEKTTQNLAQGEVLDTVHMQVNDVLNMILSGTVIDGSLQLGVLLAIQKGLLNRSTRSNHAD
jgi:ADP-ribose pyrophosphatase